MTEDHRRSTIIRTEWERAAPGWARWESTIGEWMRPATEVMLDMAGLSAGDTVLDLACGTGIQTLRAARRVGPRGRVVANDIAVTMLDHVRQKARRSGLRNVSFVAGRAEDIDVVAGSFDACICHLGLMLFVAPDEALKAARRALRPGGRMAVLVFTTPAANPFMAKPMEILLRRTGKKRPGPGEPGIFALGSPGVLSGLLERCGFDAIEERKVSTPLRMEGGTARTLAMMQDAFGAYRAVLRDSSEAERAEAWDEVRQLLDGFRGPAGFQAPAEVLAAAGRRPEG